MPIVIAPSGIKYNPWKTMDVKNLITKLLKLVEGAAGWIRALHRGLQPLEI